MGPFQKGQEIGQELVNEGLLDATSLNSTQQHQEDAAFFAQNRCPDANEEDQRTVAAGIMQCWQQHKNWTF
jgi:hypothetical protein